MLIMTVGRKKVVSVIDTELSVKGREDLADYRLLLMLTRQE
jgi:hypothetical protein